MGRTLTQSAASGPSELPVPPRSILSLTNLNVERLSTIDCCLIILEWVTELMIGQAAGLIRLSLPETKSNTQTCPNRNIAAFLIRHLNAFK